MTVHMPALDRTASDVQVHRLQRILEAARLLNSTVDLSEVTNTVLQIVRDELMVDRGTVFLVDHEKKVIRSIVAQELDSIEIWLPLGEGVAGTVASNGVPLDIPDAYEDPRFDSSFDRKFDYCTRDVFCTPIANSEGKVIGVLQLLNRSRAFTAEDHQFLSDVSVHIALALERACLYEEILKKRKLEQELLMLRDQLSQAEKMAVMGELISGVVHEIRNPLSIVVGYCEVLKDEAAGMPNLMNRAEKVEVSAKRALKVIQNFLNFAGTKKGERTIANTNDLLRQTCDLLAYEWKMRDIAIDQHLGFVPPVMVNVGQLQQVFLNIFKNAQDAACARKSGRRLSVESSHNTERGCVRIAISDNGLGIEPDVRSKIFEPFVTTKPLGIGTGLGLSISRRIIEEHEGAIWFESDLGQGTTFYIEIPALNLR